MNERAAKERRRAARAVLGISKSAERGIVDFQEEVRRRRVALYEAQLRRGEERRQRSRVLAAWFGLALVAAAVALLLAGVLR